jgi:sugar phosphate isomerase/epimerase
MKPPIAAADIGISTSCYHGERLTPAHLDRLEACGFHRLELMASPHHLDYHDRAHRREIVDWFTTHPARPASVHLPFGEMTPSGSLRPISALSGNLRERSRARDEIKRALEMTEQLGVSRVVVHLGVPGQTFNPVLFDHTYALLDEIRRFAGVEILIETLDNEVTVPARIREFLDLTQIPGVGICYDVGHRPSTEDPDRFERVREIHLDDNDGDGDSHMWPFAGILDWPELAGQLVAEGFDGTLVLEGSTPDPERAREAADRLADVLAEAASSPEDRKHAPEARLS